MPKYKDILKLSKRSYKRRFQVNENSFYHKIHNAEVVLNPIASLTCDEQGPETHANINTSSIDENENATNSDNENLESLSCYSSHSQENYEFDNSGDINAKINISSIDENEKSTNFDENSETLCSFSSHSQENAEIDCGDFLKEWAIKFNITHCALNVLLKYFKSNGFFNFPSDCRTLLGTPTVRTVISVHPGKYVHMSIKKALDHLLNHSNKNITNVKLDFNVDGVPISRSTNECFWVILSRTQYKEFCVFPVGIYHGHEKPHDFRVFLKPLVNEIKSLMDKYEYNNSLVQVSLGIFILDAPAHSSVAGIKSHTGYSSCPKCVVEGDWVKNRVVFLENDACLRTNETFRNRTDESHHKYTSPLEEIESFDMVDGFPPDYLHSVLLGVVRKFLNILVNSKPPHKLASFQINQISSRLLDLSPSMPDGFQRRIRSLKELGHFKGTEFRTFLLYTGAFVLKDILTKDKYEHFLLLMVSIRFLCTPNVCKEMSEFVNILLRTYVTQFGEYYGKENLSYNMHSLIHLTDAVQKNGTLDQFSGFCFESYNYQLKRRLRKNNQSLSQIHNRVEELRQIKMSSFTEIEYPHLKMKKGNIYEEVISETFHLSVKTKNSWFITENGNIVKFQYAKIISNNIYAFGSEVESKNNFFIYPIQSSHLKIYETSKKLCTAKFWPLSSITNTLFCMESNGTYVMVPII